MMMLQLPLTEIPIPSPNLPERLLPRRNSFADNLRGWASLSQLINVDYYYQIEGRSGVTFHLFDLINEWENGGTP